MSKRTVSPMFLLAMALVLLSWAACSAGGAATINVPGNYSTIQAAINASASGDEVVVAAGMYHERINFNGKAITVRSTTPTDPAVVAATIINGDAGGSVVSFKNWETASAVLSGFTLTNGTGTVVSSTYEGGGIYTLYASPTITNNVIRGNTADFGGGMFCNLGNPTISGNTVRGNSVVYSGGGIYCYYGSYTVANNVVTGNTAAYYGGGIDCTYGGGTVINNTISGNAATGQYGGGLLLDRVTVAARNNIITSSTSGGGVYITNGTSVDFKYCDVYDNTGGNYLIVADQTGSYGNISVDPLFADAAGGDFHEKSIVGRWNGTNWVGDGVVSPCIDAGDPASAFANEPAPNGGRINMGAYGNTPWASKTGSTPIVTYSVSGQILDNGATAVAGVRLSAAGNQTTTDAGGNYTLSGLLTGNHTVTPSLTGYTFAPPNAAVTVGPNATGVDFVATPVPVTPTVIANLPANGSVNPEMPVIMAAFSTAMDKPSVQGAISITPARAGAAAPGWPGVFVWLNNQMQFRIGTSLAPNRTYTVTISTAAQSLGGAPLLSDKVWSFTTSGVPGVVWCYPTGTAVPLSTTGKVIRLKFNQAMNHASAENALWIYKSGSPTPVRPPGAFTWWGTEMRYTFTNKLDPLTRYTVRLGKTAQSLAGVSRLTNLLWIFKTTGAATSPARVTVASTRTSVGAQITINLASAANVSVSISNLAGRNVAMLQPGALTAGLHSLLWDGKSATGTKVPPGTYLLQVNARAADGSSCSALTSLRR